MKKFFIFAISIFLILLFVPTLSLSYIEKETKTNDNVDNQTPSIANDNSFIIDIYDVNKKETFSIEMEEYLKGVVAAEMPANFELEALKAQAITARTYLLYKLKKYNGKNPDHPQASICTGIHCQVWYSKNTLEKLYGKEWFDKYWDKICESVDSTNGLILTYDDKIIEPLFHSTSGGRTENSEDVFSSAMPYLRSVESPYEYEAPKLNSSVKLPINDFIYKLKTAYKNINLTKDNLKNKIALLDVSEGGKIKTIKIDNIEASGREIRALFNLNSTNFKFIQSDNEIEILTTGYGHGVGMSQWGANGMAQNGYSYTEILTHYYTGVEIANINN